MSSRRDVLKSLSDARPDRLDPDPSSHRDHPSVIMAHAQSAAGAIRAARRPARRSTRRLVLAGLVPTVAVAAAAAVFVTVSAGRTGTGTPGPSVHGGPGTVTTSPLPASAHELFLVAATRNESSTATTGRFWVVATETGEVRQKGPASRPYNIMLRITHEIWQATRAGEENFVAYQYLGAAPVSDADKAAWIADGSPTQWVEPPPDSLPDAKPVVIRAAAEPRYARPIEDPTRLWSYVVGGTQMTAQQLAALPTDPEALKALLLKQFKDQGSPEPVGYSLFWSGRHLVFGLPVSPQVRAAAYRMLAEIEGVTFLGPATDQRGRNGLAVAYTRKGDSGRWSQTRLIIDPQTGQALAEESWNLGNGASAAPTGELMSYSLLLSAGFSDDAPPIGLPTRPAGQ